MLDNGNSVDLHPTICFLNQKLISRDRKHVRWRTLEGPKTSTRRGVFHQGLFEFEPVPSTKTPCIRISLLPHKLSKNNCIAGECLLKSANVGTAPDRGNLNLVLAPRLSLKDACP